MRRFVLARRRVQAAGTSARSQTFTLAERIVVLWELNFFFVILFEKKVRMKQDLKYIELILMQYDFRLI